MKIQNMAVIFVLIIVPISFTLSGYMDTQINVITMQSSYDSMLLNATYDTVGAFQINSLNNAYSSINDSKIRDINAAVNSFYNRLALAMGVSGFRKDDLKSYIPALLFTMYDGFYVYGEYDNVVKEIDSSGSQKQVVYKTSENTSNYKDGIRPYIYYTCEYKTGSIDIVVNYTLDNYITIMGKDQNGPINISGYLIDPASVTNVNENARILTASGVQIAPEDLGEYLVVVDTIRETGSGLGNGKIIREHYPDTRQTDSDGTKRSGRATYYKYVYFNNQKYYRDEHPNTSNTTWNNNATINGVSYFKLDNNVRVYVSQDELNSLANYLGSAFAEFKDISAFKYYQEAQTFSTTVKNKLSVIKPSHAQTSSYTTQKKDESGNIIPKRDESGQGKEIFNVSSTLNDPTLSTSDFNEHRIAIIVSTIESNLMSIIANFNLHANPGYEFVLPIINESDWYNIANNVSVVSFMQGMPIGNYKYYNNYAISLNTKNKEFVSADSIYITPKETGYDFDNEYHNPRCEHVQSSGQTYVGYKNIDFERQKITYTRDQYSQEQQLLYFPHVGIGSYNCIVTSTNVKFTTDDLSKRTNTIGVSTEVKRAYLIALAREKFITYKVSSYFGIQ